MRPFPLDGALLLFDRDTGWNVLLDGDETAALCMQAPRAVQFAITNRCNLACTFCSRDTEAASAWTAESAFAMLSGLAEAGVLEVAFGGGEPWAFPGFAELVRRLYAGTPLAISLTTNGLSMTPERLAAIDGCYGQIRLSLYDDIDWRARVGELSAARARFGVNWLVTPARLPEVEATVLELAGRGCRDVLLLSYNGADRALHLSPEQADTLARRVAKLAARLPRVTLKLDVCWGERMEAVPRLLDRADCGAGREFVVLTSDRQLSPCSFHHVKLPVETAADVMRAWRDERALLASAAREPGCARTPGYGL